MKYDKTKKKGGNRWNRGRDKLKQGKKNKRDMQREIDELKKELRRTR